VRVLGMPLVPRAHARRRLATPNGGRLFQSKLTFLVTRRLTSESGPSQRTSRRAPDGWSRCIRPRKIAFRSKAYERETICIHRQPPADLSSEQASDYRGSAPCFVLSLKTCTWPQAPLTSPNRWRSVAPYKTTSRPTKPGWFSSGPHEDVRCVANARSPLRPVAGRCNIGRRSRM
jgi:hypothetical protein